MGITISDGLIVLSTLLSPTIAVQVQKFIERKKAQLDRKAALFEALMSNRGDNNQERKRALNMIDIVFHNDRTITNAWRNYFDNLSENLNSENEKIILQNREQLFINLLKCIAESLGYKYDDVIYKRGHYSPIAQHEYESDQATIRKGLIDVLEGKPLRMQTSLEINPEAMKAQIDLQNKLASTINEKGEMMVSSRRRQS